jgi:hypothetical protein
MSFGRYHCCILRSRVGCRVNRCVNAYELNACRIIVWLADAAKGAVKTWGLPADMCAALENPAAAAARHGFSQVAGVQNLLLCNNFVKEPEITGEFDACKPRIPRGLFHCGRFCQLR